MSYIYRSIDILILYTHIYKCHTESYGTTYIYIYMCMCIEAAQLHPAANIPRSVTYSYFQSLSVTIGYLAIEAAQLHPAAAPPAFPDDTLACRVERHKLEAIVLRPWSHQLLSDTISYRQLLSVTIGTLLAPTGVTLINCYQLLSVTISYYRIPCWCSPRSRTTFLTDTKGRSP